MKIALICEKCAKVHTEGVEDATLIVDFRQKHLIFICMRCKHDNVFEFTDWQDKSGQSPLPGTRIM